MAGQHAARTIETDDDPRVRRLSRIAAKQFGILPESRAPLYLRVSAQIRKTITTGVADIGARLPTEEELARHFNVSLITVRSALKALQDGGLIERQQGRGTFVKALDVRPAEWGLGSVEDLVMTGRLTRVAVLHCAVAPAPAWARELLREPSQAGFLHVRITRNQQGKPLLMTDAYYPADVAMQISRPDLADLFVQSPLLIEVVERLTGQRATSMRQTMTASLATADVARTIDVKRRSPVLVITRVNRNQDGRLLQLARSHYRTDGVAYSIHLKRG